MPAKKKLQKIHAKRRFKTRFGISLTPELHNFLVNRIQNNDASIVEKQSNRVSIWDIDVKELFGEYPEIDSLRVVYDRNTKNIVTILFKDGPII